VTEDRASGGVVLTGERHPHQGGKNFHPNAVNRNRAGDGSRSTKLRTTSGVAVPTFTPARCQSVPDARQNRSIRSWMLNRAATSAGALGAVLRTTGSTLVRVVLF
jgi:hypothetical protein